MSKNTLEDLQPYKGNQYGTKRIVGAHKEPYTQFVITTVANDIKNYFLRGTIWFTGGRCCP